LCCSFDPSAANWDKKTTATGWLLNEAYIAGDERQVASIALAYPTKMSWRQARNAKKGRK